MELFIAMTMAHMVADWLLQTEYQAMRKMQGAWWNDAALAHASVYTLCIGLVLGWFGVTVWWLPIVWASHIFLDRRWPIVWWLVHIKRMSPHTIESLWWLALVVDQTFHLLVLYGIACGV